MFIIIQILKHYILKFFIRWLISISRSMKLNAAVQWKNYFKGIYFICFLFNLFISYFLYKSIFIFKMFNLDLSNKFFDIFQIFFYITLIIINKVIHKFKYFFNIFTIYLVIIYICLISLFDVIINFFIILYNLIWITILRKKLFLFITCQ